MVIDLLKRCHRHSTIDVLATRGVAVLAGRELPTRTGVYSDPADWPRLAEAHRREFLERTRSAASSHCKPRRRSIRRAAFSRAGRASRPAVQAREHDVIVTIAYDQERERVAYDAVVVAIGFDGRWFEGLLGDHASARYREALGGGWSWRVTSAPTCPWPACRRCTCRSWPGLRRGRGSRILQLPRPAGRPHPAPLCRGQRCRSAGTGEEAAWLSFQ